MRAVATGGRSKKTVAYKRKELTSNFRIGSAQVELSHHSGCYLGCDDLLVLKFQNRVECGDLLGVGIVLLA